MFSPEVRSVSLDPWVAPRGRLESEQQFSRRTAERFSVLQALRERRNARRSTRSSPRPDQGERSSRPIVDTPTSAESEELASVG